MEKHAYKQWNVRIKNELFDWFEEHYDNKTEFLNGILQKLCNGEIIEPKYAKKTIYVPQTVLQQTKQINSAKYETSSLLASFLYSLPSKQVREWKPWALKNYPEAYKEFKIQRKIKNKKLYDERMKEIKNDEKYKNLKIGPEYWKDSKVLFKNIVEKAAGIPLDIKKGFVVEEIDGGNFVGVRFYSMFNREIFARHLTSLNCELKYNSQTYPSEDKHEEYEYELFVSYDPNKFIY